MASIDIFVNETTRHADVILPPVSMLAHENYDIVFNALAIRNVARIGRWINKVAVHVMARDIKSAAVVEVLPECIAYEIRAGGTRELA